MMTVFVVERFWSLLGFYRRRWFAAAVILMDLCFLCFVIPLTRLEPPVFLLFPAGSMTGPSHPAFFTNLTT
jgi:hypothetical protein